MDASQLVDIIKAVAALAWPLIAAVLLIALFPAIRAIIRSRNFSVKVAGMEISVQAATEQVRAQIEDLQRQVIALRDASPVPPAAFLPEPPPVEFVQPGPAIVPPVPVQPGAPPPAPSPAPSISPSPQPSARRPGRVLWVDDKMSNNAFQIAQLHDAGVTVVQSPSTEDAMAILASSPPFDAVISDMGRREGGRYDQNAGLTLLRRMREGGFLTPFIVYSSQKYAERNRAEVIAATGDGATSSPVELMEWVRSKVQA